MQPVTYTPDTNQHIERIVSKELGPTGYPALVILRGKPEEVFSAPQKRPPLCFKLRDHKTYGAASLNLLRTEPTRRQAHDIAFNRALEGLRWELMFMYYFDELDMPLRASLGRWMDQKVYRWGTATMKDAICENDAIACDIDYNGRLAVGYEKPSESMPRMYYGLSRVDEGPNTFLLFTGEQDRLRLAVERFVEGRPTKGMVQALVLDNAAHALLGEMFKMYVDDGVDEHVRGRIRLWMLAKVGFVSGRATMMDAALFTYCEVRQIVRTWPEDTDLLLNGRVTRQFLQDE